MQHRLKILAIVLTVGMSAAAVHAAELPLKGAELAAQAAVKVDAARATALKAYPGEVTEQELEKTKAGNLLYSFTIKSHGKEHEVNVDAQTGKLAADDEGDEKDAEHDKK